MNDYFLINVSYYGADDARRQYYWEECLHDWLKSVTYLCNNYGAFCVPENVDLTGISWYYKRNEYNTFPILTAG